MAKELFSLTTLTIFYDWANDEGSSHSFGNVEGARRWINEQLEHDKNNNINSYSIEENAYIPCDANDPNGKLYLGVRHFEFVDVKGNKEREAV